MITRNGIVYLTAQEAALRHHYDTKHVQALWRLNKVFGMKLQGVVYVDRDDMQAYTLSRKGSKCKIK